MSHHTQQIRFCKSRDGTRIAYATCGAGPPLVWAAHFMGHLKLEWDNPVWRPWLFALAQRHTLIRYDGRGCGLSDRNGVEFSLPKYVQDLEAVVEAAGIRRFVLFGISSGGGVAMNLAVGQPDRVSHLVLYGCYTRGRIARSTIPEQREDAHTRLKAIEVGWGQANPAFRQLYTSLWIPDATAEQSRSFNDLIRESTTPINAVEIMRTAFALDLRETAPQIRCPTLVLHAREDAVAPFEEGRALAALIPAARFVPLESRNHLLLDSEPAWQQLVNEMNDFLPAKPAGGSDFLLDELTSREHEVLELMAQGHDNETIGMQLEISAKTVRNQVSIIFSKLGVNSRAQAIVRARDAGFGHKTSG